jgi:hypothetical protein
MLDAYMKADLQTAIASGQWIIANKDNLGAKKQSLGLCATTLANFGSQVLLKDDPDITPIGAVLLGQDQKAIFIEAVAVLEAEHNALTQAKGAVPGWLIVLAIQAAIETLKKVLENFSK